MFVRAILLSFSSIRGRQALARTRPQAALAAARRPALHHAIHYKSTAVMHLFLLALIILLFSTNSDNDNYTPLATQISSLMLLILFHHLQLILYG
jgi:hypothetical protein